MWGSTIKSNAHNYIPDFDRRRRAAWIADRDLQTKCLRESVHSFEIGTVKSWETKNWRKLGTDLRKLCLILPKIGDLMEGEGLRLEIWWRVRVDVRWGAKGADVRWELEGWSVFENKRASQTLRYTI